MLCVKRQYIPELEQEMAMWMCATCINSIGAVVADALAPGPSHHQLLCTAHTWPYFTSESSTSVKMESTHCTDRAKHACHFARLGIPACECSHTTGLCLFCANGRKTSSDSSSEHRAVHFCTRGERFSHSSHVNWSPAFWGLEKREIAHWTVRLSSTLTP